MGMFGGGTTASATYRRTRDLHHRACRGFADGERSRGNDFRAWQGSAAGKPTGFSGLNSPQSDDGLQGVVNNKVMINVSGDASIEDKTAALETMDFKALGGF